MEKKCFVKTMVMLLALGAMGSASAEKFNSGSTGKDGDFDPETNITLESRTYNFTNVNIREGVTVFFSRNGPNAPVVILATGDVNIAGTIDISGKSAAPIKGGTGTNFPEGGIGGPGGFNGGRGGDPGGGPGGSGQGVGGGMGGTYLNGNYAEGGGGAGYLTAGGMSFLKQNYGNASGVGGASHGSNTVLPVLGGSGGGGGAGAASITNGSTGGGGGGGGGAILIAASGKVSLSGAILARGGRGGLITPAASGALEGGEGGGGSGGMIRILASSFQTGGTLDVSGGEQSFSPSTYYPHRGGTGSHGRTSTETMFGGTLSLNGLPVLAISRIGGVDVPTDPTGTADVGLPLTLANPVPVQLVAQNVPLNAIVKLMMVPVYGGNSVTVDAAALSGSLENSTTTANIDLPAGPSMLTAYVTYSVSLAMGEALSTYAMGERVEKVTLAAAPGQETQAILTTVSGREFKIHPSVLMMMSAV